MAGQVCKEVRDESGKLLGFEVVGHVVNGVDVYTKQDSKPVKKKGK